MIPSSPGFGTLTCALTANRFEETIAVLRSDHIVFGYFLQQVGTLKG
jgi:hypothetical protein